MPFIVGYTSEDEMNNLRQKYETEGYVLIEVQNVTEGDFLVFREPGWLPPAEAASLTDQIAALRTADLDNKSMINDLGETLLALLEG